MKKIGIIFAMKEELDEFLNLVEKTNEYKIFDLDFYECNSNDKELVLVESGIGKVNAARATQILIDNMEVEYIFNVGVAGSVNKDVKVLDVVIGDKLVQHDFDITAFNYEKGYIPNIGAKFVESDPYLIKVAQEVGDENTHKGVIASGDIFCTEEAMSIYLIHLQVGIIR